MVQCLLKPGDEPKIDAMRRDNAQRVLSPCCCRQGNRYGRCRVPQKTRHHFPWSYKYNRMPIGSGWTIVRPPALVASCALAVMASPKGRAPPLAVRWVTSTTSAILSRPQRRREATGWRHQQPRRNMSPQTKRRRLPACRLRQLSISEAGRSGGVGEAAATTTDPVVARTMADVGAAGDWAATSCEVATGTAGVETASASGDKPAGTARRSSSLSSCQTSGSGTLPGSGIDSLGSSIAVSALGSWSWSWLSSTVSAGG